MRAYACAKTGCFGFRRRKRDVFDLPKIGRFENGMFSLSGFRKYFRNIQFPRVCGCARFDSRDYTQRAFFQNSPKAFSKQGVFSALCPVVGLSADLSLSGIKKDLRYYVCKSDFQYIYFCKKIYILTFWVFPRSRKGFPEPAKIRLSLIFSVGRLYYIIRFKTGYFQSFSDIFNNLLIY